MLLLSALLLLRFGRKKNHTKMTRLEEEKRQRRVGEEKAAAPRRRGSKLFFFTLSLESDHHVSAVWSGGSSWSKRAANRSSVAGRQSTPVVPRDVTRGSEAARSNTMHPGYTKVHESCFCHFFFFPLLLLHCQWCPLRSILTWESDPSIVYIKGVGDGGSSFGTIITREFEKYLQSPP